MCMIWRGVAGASL